MVIAIPRKLTYWAWLFDMKISKSIKNFILIPIAIILIIICAATVVQITLLPGLVQKEIVATLRKSGLPNTGLTVKSVTWRGAELENVHIGFEKELQIDTITVSYSLWSLFKGKITDLHLKGLELGVSLKNHKFDAGPLAKLMHKGAAIPFSNLYLDQSQVHVNLEGRLLELPLNAVFRKTGKNNGTLKAQTRVLGAEIKTEAALDLDKNKVRDTFAITGLNPGWFEIVSSILPSLKRISGAGQLNVNGRLAYENNRWSGGVNIHGDSLILAYTAGYQNTSVPFRRIEATAIMDTGMNIAGKVSAAIFKSPAKINAAFNPARFSGRCEYTVDNIDHDIINVLQSRFFSGTKLTTSGLLAIEGSLNVENDTGSAEFRVKGAGFNLQARLGENDLSVVPVSVTTKTTCIIDGRALVLGHSSTAFAVSRCSSKKMDLAATNLLGTLSVDWKTHKIPHGSWSMDTLYVPVLSFSKLTGTIAGDTKGLRLQANARLGPWALVNAQAALLFGKNGLKGNIQASVPKFATKDNQWLSGLIPAIKGDELGGTFSAGAALSIDKGQLTQHYTFGLKQVEWRRAKAHAGVYGVTSVLGITSFVPLMTDGDQRLTLDSAAAGGFKIKNGKAVFRFSENRTVAVPSLEMNWARGRLYSRDIAFKFSEPHIALAMNAEALNLQDILDFMNYHDVRGDGKIYGHVPIALSWGNKPHLSLGNGFLEARPPQGGLAFSKEAAMQILGIKGPIDPKTKDEQEIVRLMMARALQDMEYTRLDMVLKNDERKVLMATINMKGYGPRGEKENRIPVGGITVHINGMDDLLNQVVFAKTKGSEN